MSTSVWDNPELKVGGEFVKFDNVGDTISGTISAIRAHKFDDGSVAPQILLVTDDGEERTVTAGQIRLKTALAEQRPEASDHITITYTQNEKRAGGKTLKHFDLVVKRGTGETPAAALASTPVATSSTPTASPDPTVLAAAMANLTPEQKAALGIPA